MTAFNRTRLTGIAHRHFLKRTPKRRESRTQDKRPALHIWKTPCLLHNAETGLLRLQGKLVADRLLSGIVLWSGVYDDAAAVLLEFSGNGKRATLSVSA